VPTLDGLGIDGDGAHTEWEHGLISSIEPRTRLMRGCWRRCSRGGQRHPLQCLTSIDAAVAALHNRAASQTLSPRVIRDYAAFTAASGRAGKTPRSLKMTCAAL
jgi:hypothetical protein